VRSVRCSVSKLTSSERSEAPRESEQQQRPSLKPFQCLRLSRVHHSFNLFDCGRFHHNGPLPDAANAAHHFSKGVTVVELVGMMNNSTISIRIAGDDPSLPEVSTDLDNLTVESIRHRIRALGGSVRVQNPPRAESYWR
jgi:hypothetical protein